MIRLLMHKTNEKQIFARFIGISCSLIYSERILVKWLLDCTWWPQEVKWGRWLGSEVKVRKWSEGEDWEVKLGLGSEVKWERGFGSRKASLSPSPVIHYWPFRCYIVFHFLMFFFFFFWETDANSTCRLFILWLLYCICLSFHLIVEAWCGSDYISSWVIVFTL